MRPNFYLQNFLRQPSIRAAGEFSLPLIHAPISFVDVGDIAHVAARVLTTEGHDGRVHDLTGPEALTYAEVADEFSHVLGRPVRYVGLPDDEARAAMLRGGMPEFHVDALMEVARAYREGGAETVTSTVPDITGVRPSGVPHSCAGTAGSSAGSRGSGGRAGEPAGPHRLSRGREEPPAWPVP
ncbi:hypothetical protein [Streptomyces sp. NPDC052107]|uniref:NmrA family NAD(P)-binding protein n=1 Tax=Streptomyces sp. NPDC052107 TaxID=3155632 RepID=UPI003425BC46